ncbi:MAG: FeoA family protein [Syntrophomonadales bacterium]|jgi:Fe2+ transport system protein FeoA
MQNKLSTVEPRKSTNLAGVQAGKRVRIIELPQGRHSMGRLINLGIGPGVEVEVMNSHPFRGPIVVRVDGGPVAIGHSLAQRIRVEEMPVADQL